MERFVGPESVSACCHSDAAKETDDVTNDPQEVEVRVSDDTIDSPCEETVHQYEEEDVSPHDSVL